METVTSFSASLLQSLGGNTEEAAKVSDMAITDMADNANKMGTSMEAIQNAYQGFAKQNYTMLDNLKLGYGGTKEEMQRLLDDAEKFSGVKYDISNLNDVYQAIHVVQGELGITGTTAKEASETISGSVSAMKSSWQNLITGIADDNADFDGLINNFVDSVETAGNNIIPRVETTINGVGKLVEKLAPIIADKIPVIVNNVLPGILNSAATLVNGFIGGLVDLLPTIVQSGGDVLMSLLQGILDSAPAIVDGVMAAIDAFIDFVTENLPMIVETGIEILGKLAVGMIKAIPDLVAKLPQIIAAVVKGFAAGINSLIEVGQNIVKGVWEGITEMAGWIKDKVTGFFSGIVDGVKGFLGIHSPSRVFASIGDYMMQGLDNGIADGADSVMKTTENAMGDVLDVAEDMAGELGSSMEFSPSIAAKTAAASVSYSANVTSKGENKNMEEIKYLLEQIANKDGNVYIDGDRLVGATAGKMDRQLGKISGNNRVALTGG